MASRIYEYFGRPAAELGDALPGALPLIDGNCPFISGTCEKFLSDGQVSGVCSLKPARSAPVICCPIRLYGDDYKMLRHIADVCWGPGLELFAGGEAVTAANDSGALVVAVFGKKWGGELRLPKRAGRGGYFVDWVLALVEPGTGLSGFVAVEVQTIDTTGNYRNGIASLRESGKTVATTAGLNWENVNKRIIPQLIYKGQVLEREPLCTHGLFFVCPSPVYTSVMDRLGGEERINDMPMRGNSLNFLQWDYEPADGTVPIPLGPKGLKTTSVGDVWQAFHGNSNLPPVGVYAEAINAVLDRLML